MSEMYETLADRVIDTDVTMIDKIFLDEMGGDVDGCSVSIAEESMEEYPEMAGKDFDISRGCNSGRTCLIVNLGDQEAPVFVFFDGITPQIASKCVVALL